MAARAVLGIEEGSFGYDATPLFKDISFQLDQERTALVGDNGSGKSTLLKCLAGILELNTGRVIRSRGAKVVLVEQDVPQFPPETTTREVLRQFLDHGTADGEDWRIDVMFEELAIPDSVSDGTFESLSVGWKRLVLMAGALQLADPDVVLMDEPTNHLDLGNIRVLEAWIEQSRNLPMLIVSHDREFLEHMTTRTIFLRADGVHSFGTSFSAAREALMQRDAANARRHQLEEREIRRLEQVAARYRVWGQTNASFHKRQKATEKRIDRLDANRTEIYRPTSRTLSLESEAVDAAAILRIKNLTVTTPDQARVLFSIDRLTVRSGEKVAILGPNGCGKSTLLRLLSAAADKMDDAPDSAIRFNPQLRIATFDQQLESVPLDAQIGDWIAQAEGVTRAQVPSLLARAGFPFARQKGPIRDLSLGERSRLAFLRLSLAKPGLYILDEPTNHLDIAGQEALETELEVPQTSCVFVSHDRFFTRRAATRFLEIRNRKVVEVESPDHFFASI